MPPKKIKSLSLTSLSNILPQVSRDLGLDQKVQELSVVSLWARLVDDNFKTRTQALRVKRRGDALSLWVKVPDASTAGELSFYIEEYRERLNGFYAQTGLRVEKIEIKIGPLH